MSDMLTVPRGAGSSEAHEYGRMADCLQTVAVALETLELLLYDNDGASSVIVTGRAALGEIFELMRGGTGKRADGRPEGEQEDANIDRGRRRPVRGRAVSRVGEAGP